jgi:hypothetical protein
MATMVVQPTEEDGMTSAEERASPVTRRARPPVRQSTLVRSDASHTFDVMVRTIGAWWPVQPMSFGKERVRDVTIEQRAGGRIYETWHDGTTVDWGEMLVWEPPARFVMSWLGTPEPTEVELSFNALGPALTRVSVEHRGWEALSEEQLSEDCAAPGGYRSGAYSTGWIRILSAFGAAVEGDIQLTPQEDER